MISALILTIVLYWKTPGHRYGQKQKILCSFTNNTSSFPDSELASNCDPILSLSASYWGVKVSGMGYVRWSTMYILGRHNAQGMKFTVINSQVIVVSITNSSSKFASWRQVNTT
jgi:hypothetical protein